MEADTLASFPRFPTSPEAPQFPRASEDLAIQSFRSLGQRFKLQEGRVVWTERALES